MFMILRQIMERDFIHLLSSLVVHTESICRQALLIQMFGVNYDEIF